MIISDSWDLVIDMEKLRPIFSWLPSERVLETVYPTEGKEFNAFRLTPFQKVKVVIMGQDPYPGTDKAGIPHAHGLAFSSQSSETPKSLQNIFKELSKEFGRGPRTNADLSDWAEQGVLLLNSSLTVKAGKPNSHEGVWDPLIKMTIEAVSSRPCKYGTVEPTVFMLWGNDALQIFPYIRFKSQHLILQAAHPSPMAAYRGFLGCGHFIEANRWLSDHDKDPIHWI